MYFERNKSTQYTTPTPRVKKVPQRI